MTGADQFVPRLHKATWGNKSICVDFYSYGTNDGGKSIIDQIVSLLAHNSKNYENHKSLELDIVVKRVVLVFSVCFVVVVHLLIDKGIVCSNSFVTKACYQSPQGSLFSNRLLRTFMTFVSSVSWSQFGARNMVIQVLCPLRATSTCSRVLHIGMT